MSRYWSDFVQHLSPYQPGEQPPPGSIVKLNTNENPYPPSPRVLQALRDAADERLRLYPDPRSLALRDAIARRHGVQREQVFVGNSSDEVLALAFAALLRHGEGAQARPVLLPDISYGFYPSFCGLFGIAHRSVPLDERFRVRVDDYAQPDAAGVVIANPNAPTGIALPLDEIERLLVACREQVVLIDEAYVDFGAGSAVPLVQRHPNLLVVQTLSKSRSLAGLRVGFAIGQAHLIEALMRVKDSFNAYPLGRLAQAGALAAIEDEEHFECTRRALMRTRDQLAEGLAACGIEVLPSSTNFLFARHPTLSGARWQAALRERGYLVRRFAQPARIADFLRISIGTDAQCQGLLDAVRDIDASLAEPRNAHAAQ